MIIEYDTIPVGTEGQYMVQRSDNGEVRYLALQSNPPVIGRFSLGFATATCKALRAVGHHAEQVWLERGTDHLDTRKPMSMFPPARRSSFCELGRA